MSNESLRVQHMTADEILSRLADWKEFCEEKASIDGADKIFWNFEADALEAAIAIINALKDEGINDAAGVKDLIFDYKGLSRQYRELSRIHINAARPIYKDGVWHCPECNSRTSFNHSFCHKCGKKLGGWKK